MYISQRSVSYSYLIRINVLPQIRLLILLHVAQLTRRLVDEQEVRHQRDDLSQLEARQLDLQHELATATGNLSPLRPQWDDPNRDSNWEAITPTTTLRRPKPRQLNWWQQPATCHPYDRNGTTQTATAELNFQTEFSCVRKFPSLIKQPSGA